MGAYEHNGACLPGHSSWQKFFNMLSNAGLFELPHTGVNLTWHGKRRTRWVFHKLDRMLSNSAWLHFWAYSAYHAYPRTHSDHCPLVLRYLQVSDYGPFPSI